MENEISPDPLIDSVTKEPALESRIIRPYHSAAFRRFLSLVVDILCWRSGIFISASSNRF